MVIKIFFMALVLSAGFGSSQAAHRPTRRAPRIVAGSSGYSVSDLTYKLGEAVFRSDSIGLIRTYLTAGAHANGNFQPPKPDDSIRRLEFPYKEPEHILKLAVSSGRCDVVELLLEHGAQVREGYLEKAAAQGDVEMAWLLLECGADVNECEHVGDKMEHGWTPLYAAVANRKLEMVKFLLACDSIDVNVVRSSRFFIQRYNFRCLIVKVGESASYDFRLWHDNISRTPLDCAEFLQETKIAELLRQAGGKTV
ncbi:ankyrin repeat domain-containing protein [Candidatus Babeliales bacterium]|nr:ankyrin repeat domain-containing protein [Candidatus Babeliales bacterium]